MPSNSKNIAELLNNQTTITADDLASTLDLSSKTLTVPANSVTTHVTQTDLTPVKQDLALLAFDQIRADNRTLLNMPNSFVDQYEDSTGIDSLTTCVRGSDEKVSSYNYGQKGFDEVGIEMLNGKPNITQTTWDVGNAYSTNWANDTILGPTSSNYTYGIVNYLFDLSTDFQINVYAKVNSSGAPTGTPYIAYSAFITTDTSVAPGKQGASGSGVFKTEGSATQTYGSVSPNYFNTNNLTAAGQSAFNLSNSGYGDNSTIGNAGALNYNANDANFAMRTYLNQGSGSRGIRIINDTANDRIDIEYLSNGDQSVTRTDVTDTRITNVPHTGRFFFAIGEAGGTDATRGFSLSTSNPADAQRSQVFDGISNATGNYVSVAKTAPSAVTKMSIVVMYEDAVGTNALNTDIVAQVSADNGSNFTTATLAAAPNLTSNIKVAKSAEVTVTSGTQCKYKINFANQAANKQARILGVALLY